MQAVVSAGWQLTINAFSPAEEQFDICRAGAICVALGIFKCTIVEKKQQTLLHEPPVGTYRSCLSDFQFESEASGLRDKQLQTKHNCSTIIHNTCQ